MIDKLLPLVPTQAVGIVLAFLAIWVIEPATPHGMAVLGVLVLALTNAVKQVWDWLSPKVLPKDAKSPESAQAKPKRRRARSA